MKETVLKREYDDDDVEKGLSKLLAFLKWNIRMRVADQKREKKSKVILQHSLLPLHHSALSSLLQPV